MTNYGVGTAYTNIQNIFIALDNDLDPSLVSEFGEVTDLTLQASVPSTINVVSLTKQSSEWII